MLPKKGDRTHEGPNNNFQRDNIVDRKKDPTSVPRPDRKDGTSVSVCEVRRGGKVAVCMSDERGNVAVSSYI